MTVPHNQRRPGSARLTVAAGSSALSMGAVGRSRESGESVGEALPEATVTDVLRNSRFPMEVLSTVTTTPLTGKSTRSEITRTRWFPGRSSGGKATGSIRSRSRQTYAGSAFNHHFESGAPFSPPAPFR